jgi:poly(beta-D-mannuronate) C5 epimerase
LLLSQEQTVFIANAGDLFIMHTKVTGWSEKNNSPAAFKDKSIYRPFLVSWSGGRMYIAGSEIASLGYRKGKSYGITYSSCEPCTEVNPKLPRPTGAIVGNSFTDMYFGFYSYEADDIAIVNNVYTNNAVYAIDPHDRSRRLIIAGNTASGSRKKHGIIISRNVNDSWIFNNISHDNHGSGIMIDRASQNNVVANNTSAHNEGDGITFFESQNNTLYNNTVYKNNLSGIRIRNSWNIKMLNDRISDNGRVPVAIYTVQLEKSQPDRNFKQDSYIRKASATISGAIIKLRDNKPAFKIIGIDNLKLADVHIVSGGGIFFGHIFPDETRINENISAPLKATVVAKD